MVRQAHHERPNLMAVCLSVGTRESCSPLGFHPMKSRKIWVYPYRRSIDGFRPRHDLNERIPLAYYFFRILRSPHRQGEGIYWLIRYPSHTNQAHEDGSRLRIVSR